MKLFTLILALPLTLVVAACGQAPSAHADTDHADAAQAHAHADDAEDHGHAEDAHVTTIAAAVARASGIRVAPVQGGVIADEHVVQGLLVTVEGHAAQAVARYPGPVRAILVGVGDTVRKGQVVARVHSNLSLSTYAIHAPIAGVVTARHVALGAMAQAGTAVLDIADLSSLWVDLHIFGDDAGHIGPGAAVEVIRLSDGKRVRTQLERVLPGMATASQSTVARARIANADGQWRPGAAVKARVTVAQEPVTMLVPVSAVQTMDGAPVVFVRQGDSYRARAVTLGARDARQVEVLEGLEPGESVVVAESYLIKADILKEGAAHEH